MNLGGRRITNEDLRTCVEALGLGQVQTYRASGNLVFDGGRRSGPALQRHLEDGLRAALGYGVPTFIRTSEEIVELAAARPFDPPAGAGKLQVALLLEAPDEQTREAALQLAGERDRLSFGERALFWLPDGPMSASPLDWRAVEGVLGPTTVRTMGTIEQIAARYFTDGGTA